MDTAPMAFPDTDPTSAYAVVDITVPAYNEEPILARSVTTLRRYLDERFPYPATVTIVDNGSTDGTWGVATSLSDVLAGVRAIHIDAKGRGRALKASWTASEADVLVYMDADLSTDLDALLPLVAPLVSGHSDLAIGSRLARGARVVRSAKREAISRAYNVLVRAVMGNHFTDAQCGFKAVRADVAGVLLPHVRDDAWFFDTELVVLAAHNGLRIHEVPVDWVEDGDSSVELIRTALDDVRGLLRLRWSLHAGRARIPGLFGRRLSGGPRQGARRAAVGSS